jgi:energy-coupling factor transporter ATP-binding protein EcfA2
MYTLTDVTKTYVQKKRTITALNKVSLEIPTGPMVAIQGPTGGGKSTLLQMLGALDKPTAGDVLLGDKRVSALPESKLAGIRATDTVDWFPHPSPDGTMLLSMAYAAGTLGHPANHDVVLRIQPLASGAPVDGSGPRDVLALFGGQGTSNVAGWSPDSRVFACVDYPLS